MHDGGRRKRARRGGEDEEGGTQKREKHEHKKTRPFVNQSKQGFNLMLWLGALCFADGLKMSMWWVLWEWCLPRSSTRWALQSGSSSPGHECPQPLQCSPGSGTRSQTWAALERSCSCARCVRFSTDSAREHFWSCFSKDGNTGSNTSPLFFFLSDSSAHKWRVWMFYIHNPHSDVSL